MCVFARYATLVPRLITIRLFCCFGLFFTKSYIGQGCVTNYHSVCIWLFICCICTLLNAERSKAFCDEDRGQFWFLCWKKANKSPFWLWHEMNYIENSRKSSFKLSNLLSADKSKPEKGSISFVTDSFTEEGIWVSVMSLTNFSYCFWLMGANCFMVLVIQLSATYFVLSTRKSADFPLKGFTSLLGAQMWADTHPTDYH